MNVPKITNLKTVYKVYKTNLTLGNSELDLIFRPKGGKRLSQATKKGLKNMVVDYMKKNKIIQYSSSEVPTKIAFKVWGIEIEELKEILKDEI